MIPCMLQPVFPGVGSYLNMGADWHTNLVINGMYPHMGTGEISYPEARSPS
jgi:hypothetical protein